MNEGSQRQEEDATYHARPRRKPANFSQNDIAFCIVSLWFVVFRCLFAHHEWGRGERKCCNGGCATDKRKVEEHTNLGSVRLFPLAAKPRFVCHAGPCAHVRINKINTRDIEKIPLNMVHENNVSSTLQG